MGTVYKPTYTKPMPGAAEVFTRKGQRWARWIDAKGRKRTARVTTTDAGDRLLIETATYTAKYRDGAGIVRTVATGCRTLDAARAVLADLATRADKVKCGKWTAAEDAVLDHQTTPVAEHVAAYQDHLRAKPGKGGRRRVVAEHVENVKRQLDRIAAACRFSLLRDLNRRAVDGWIKAQTEAGTRAAWTINAHLATLTAFGNWCVETGRLVANPFTRLPKLDEKADPRRQRRALTADELGRLLTAAQLRPLAEYGRETVRLADDNKPDDKRSRRTWGKAGLTWETLETAAQRGREALSKRPDLIAELDRTGRERALIYKVLVLTGLRKGELASLTVGQLELEPGRGMTAYVRLDAADEKAGRGADVPLRADLAADVAAWLAERLEAARREAMATGGPVPARLPHDAPLLNVPTGLVRIFDRDLEAAGIAKRDDRRRTVDVHALRHTFGSHLSKGGVSPRTAQAAMRHSTIDLTMNTYTDPRLLDVAGALDVLPTLPLSDPRRRERARATGTDAISLVPMLVQPDGNRSTSGATAGKTSENTASRGSAVSGASGGCSQRLAFADSMEPTGIEPATPSLQS